MIDFKEYIKTCDKAINNAENVKKALEVIKSWIEFEQLSIINFDITGNFQSRPSIKLIIELPKTDPKQSFPGSLTVKTCNNNEKFDFTINPQPGIWDDDARKLNLIRTEYELTCKPMDFKEFKNVIKPFLTVSTNHETILLYEQLIKENKMKKDFK